MLKITKKDRNEQGCLEFWTKTPFTKNTLQNNTYMKTQKQSKNKAQERKNTPVYSGALAYFPDAIKYIGVVSKAGNDQHHKGSPLHWDRSKSTDQMDAATRHLIDHAKGDTIDDDGIRHLGKAAWRLLAQLQLDIENDKSN